MDPDPRHTAEPGERHNPVTTGANTDAAQSPPPAVRWIKSRWPTFLALGLVITTGGLPAMWAMHFLPVLPLIYVVLVAAGRRAATWPVLVVLTGLFLVLDHFAVDTFTFTAVIAIVGTVLAFLTGRGREATLQAMAFVTFFVVALSAMYLDHTAGVLLIAGGWAGHGLWDLWHLLRNKVVARTFAEACGVLDVLAAVALLLTL